MPLIASSYWYFNHILNKDNRDFDKTLGIKRMLGLTILIPPRSAPEPQQRFKNRSAIGRAERGVRRTLGVGHQAENVEVGTGDAGDVILGAVRGWSPRSAPPAGSQ